MHLNLLEIPLITFLLSFLLSACGVSDADVVPHNETTALQLIDSLEIQETDDRFIGELVDADIELDPLRLYIADRKMQRVAVITADGSIEQFIGKAGKGPGELGRPVFVSVDGARIVVAQQRWRGFSVFDTTGTFIDNHRLPDGHWVGGYDLIHDADGYILPITSFNPQKEGTLQLPPDQKTIAKLNSEFEVKDLFGTYPQLYQEGEYTLEKRTLDISNDSLAVVGYRLVPNVRLYDLRTKEKTLINKISLKHPNFHKPKRETPLRMATNQSDLYKRMSNWQTVEDTFLLRDSVVVQVYANHSKEYYAQSEFAPSKQEYYATLGTIDSKKRLHLTLPGEVLARDEKGRLYVELNPVPDKRKIGIYEVNWP